MGLVELFDRLAADHAKAATVDVDLVLKAACANVEGITPKQLGWLLSPEELEDVATGELAGEKLSRCAEDFADRIRSGQIKVLNFPRKFVADSTTVPGGP